ncbi:hypothetical protein GS489_06670 [Rhodococcus hoagii]|nr:hypothetical protein [Prescottella equi]
MVHIEWVKVHAGNQYNEAADRAARTIRRSHTYRIPRDAVRGVLDNIRHDIVA